MKPMSKALALFASAALAVVLSACSMTAGSASTDQETSRADAASSSSAPSDAPSQSGPGRPGGPGESRSNRAEGQIGSWSMGGTDASSADGDDYAYDAALYVTADGIDGEKTATDRIASGTYDASAATGVTISDSTSGHNAVLVHDASYDITGATIDLLTDADGGDTCDFSGKGSAIAAFGSNANVTVSDSSIHTSGVATMPVFADDGATVTIRSSVLQADGGTLHSGYLNTPSQTLMVAPPWILGMPTVAS